MIAPFVLAGPASHTAFETYVENVYVPELWSGDPEVMDSASSNRAPRMREMINAPGGSLLYLRRQSPDLNAIKNG